MSKTAIMGCAARHYPFQIVVTVGWGRCMLGADNETLLLGYFLGLSRGGARWGRISMSALVSWSLSVGVS